MTCASSSSLGLGLLGLPVINVPSCTTAPIPCPVSSACTYRTTAAVINTISVSSGARSTTFGIRRNGAPQIATSTCGGGQFCTAVSQETVGSLAENAGGGHTVAAGNCSWSTGLVSLGLGVTILCKMELINVQNQPPS